MAQSIRHPDLWRYLFTIILLTLLLLLSACGSRFALPGLPPTAEPVAMVAEQFDPAISLNPSSGHAGIYVQVTGDGWPQRMMVVVILTDPDGISTTVASNDTDSTGKLFTGFLYPIDTRWLLNGSYTVTAESADGRYRATAQFTVVEPGAEAVPTPVATSTAAAVAAAPTATEPSATTTAAPTVTPAPTATSAPQASTATSATSNRPPVVTAALIPDGERQYIVEVAASDPDGNLREVVAILALPPLRHVEDVKLKDKDKIEIKIDKEKLEISAPDPQTLLDFIQQHGGIPVQPGQRVEYKRSNNDKFKAELDDNLLKIESPDLLLRATAIDTADLVHQVTTFPPALDDENNGPGNRGENRGNDDRGGGDDDGDDEGGDDD
jgi:hypothetical protein